MGNALRLTGKPQEAAAAFEDAIARHTELLSAAPTNAELRRRLAITYGYLANVQLDLKQPQQAAESLERAIAAAERAAGRRSVERADRARARLLAEPAGAAC